MTPTDRRARTRCRNQSGVTSNCNFVCCFQTGHQYRECPNDISNAVDHPYTTPEVNDLARDGQIGPDQGVSVAFTHPSPPYTSTLYYRTLVKGLFHLHDKINCDLQFWNQTLLKA